MFSDEHSNYNQSINFLMGKEGYPELELDKVEFRKLAIAYSKTRSLGGIMSGLHRIPIIMDAMYKRIKDLEARLTMLESGIESFKSDDEQSVEEEGLTGDINLTTIRLMRFKELQELAEDMKIDWRDKRKNELIKLIIDVKKIGK